MRNTTIRSLVMVAAFYLGTVGIASACGCLQSRSFSVSSDEDNVYATATMTLSYLCTGEVTATITAPDNTTASADSGLLDGGSAMSVTATKYINDLEGDYNGSGTYYRDGQDSGLESPGYYPAMSQIISI